MPVSRKYLAVFENKTIWSFTHHQLHIWPEENDCSNSGIALPTTIAPKMLILRICLHFPSMNTGASNDFICQKEALVFCSMWREALVFCSMWWKALAFCSMWREALAFFVLCGGYCCPEHFPWSWANPKCSFWELSFTFLPQTLSKRA